MNSNATGAGTSESPTTVANGNNISKRCIQLIAQLILLSVELVQLRGQANPCDRNYAISWKNVPNFKQMTSKYLQISQIRGN